MGPRLYPQVFAEAAALVSSRFELLLTASNLWYVYFSQSVVDSILTDSKQDATIRYALQNPCHSAQRLLGRYFSTALHQNQIKPRVRSSCFETGTLRLLARFQR